MFNQYPDIMTVFDVSEALYIGRNRVYELLVNGSLKGFRVGRVWKIPKVSVISFCMNQAGIANNVQ